MVVRSPAVARVETNLAGGIAGSVGGTKVGSDRGWYKAQRKRAPQYQVEKSAFGVVHKAADDERKGPSTLGTIGTGYLGGIAGSLAGQAAAGGGPRTATRRMGVAARVGNRAAAGTQRRAAAAGTQAPAGKVFRSALSAQKRVPGIGRQRAGGAAGALLGIAGGAGAYRSHKNKKKTVV